MPSYDTNIEYLEQYYGLIREIMNTHLEDIQDLPKKIYKNGVFNDRMGYPDPPGMLITHLTKIVAKIVAQNSR